MFLDRFIAHPAKILLKTNPKDNWNDGQCSTISNYFSKYLKDMNRAISNGEFSIKPDKYNVDLDVWEKCRKLSNKGFVIGGSVVLNLYGFIDREIGDIDLFIGSDEVEIMVNESNKINDNDDTDDEYENNMEDDDSKRVKVNVEGIGIMDVFNHRVDYYIYDGVKINSPFAALQAKLKYYRTKDINDFLYMVKTI